MNSACLTDATFAPLGGKGLGRVREGGSLITARGFARSFRPLAATSLLLTAVATVGCAPDPIDQQVVSLQPTASIGAPLSTNEDVVVVSPVVACVINSYESRIHCLDRAGRAVGVFGREGEGPGEFRGSLGIVRGADGLLGTIEFPSSQLTLFRPDGIWQSETALPSFFHGTELVGTRLHGYRVARPWDPSHSPDQPIVVPMGGGRILG